jgi:hemerythrin
MEIWAEMHGNEDVQFLCVCVESLQVARQFANMFHFQHALNAYIPARQYFPRGYGQLGCSGFIVADARGNFVSRKTRAYLQYGDQAFAHVEQLLDEQRRKTQQHRATAASSIAAATAARPGGPAVVATTTAMKRETVISCTTCTPASSSTTTTDNNIDNVDYYSPPPSVGVDSMDDEHEACAAALKELFLRRTRAALQRVIQVLEQHFAHEEALMVQHGFGGDGVSEFSALRSHIKDHQRILQIGRDELQRMSVVEQQQREESAACSSSTTTTTTA